MTRTAGQFGVEARLRALPNFVIRTLSSGCPTTHHLPIRSAETGLRTLTAVEARLRALPNWREPRCTGRFEWMTTPSIQNNSGQPQGLAGPCRGSLRVRHRLVFVGGPHHERASCRRETRLGYGHCRGRDRDRALFSPVSPGDLSVHIRSGLRATPDWR